jgi:hypothetical protein
VLLARVEEANVLGSQWFITLDFIIFVTIARRAGEARFASVVLPPFDLGTICSTANEPGTKPSGV